MSDEQPGPPTEEQRERRDIEHMRIAQLRYLEGYRARVAELHPLRKNARGEVLNQREQRWSFADDVESRLPQHLPAHERERWKAGYLHADSLGSTEGVAKMERGDPSRPPPRVKREKVAEPIDAFADEVPHLSKSAAREWWDLHRGGVRRHVHLDAGEQR